MPTSTKLHLAMLTALAASAAGCAIDPADDAPIDLAVGDSKADGSLLTNVVLTQEEYGKQLTAKCREFLSCEVEFEFQPSLANAEQLREWAHAEMMRTGTTTLAVPIGFATITQSQGVLAEEVPPVDVDINAVFELAAGEPEGVRVSVPWTAVSYGADARDNVNVYMTRTPPTDQQMIEQVEISVRAAWH